MQLLKATIRKCRAWVVVGGFRRELFIWVRHPSEATPSHIMKQPSTAAPHSNAEWPIRIRPTCGRPADDLAAAQKWQGTRVA